MPLEYFMKQHFIENRIQYNKTPFTTHITTSHKIRKKKKKKKLTLKSKSILIQSQRF